jgi:hypothetical protein
MLRRFAKVLVVGELDQEQRTQTLTHYLTHFLPCEDFTDAQWSDWASKFEGATGDVLRKAIDEVWLRTIRTLISESPEEALKIVDFIKEEYGANFDVSDLNDQDRLTIKDMVGSSIKVTADVVDASVEHLLNNFAIQEQIQKCKDTYKNAAKLLNQQRRSSTGIGFGE